MPGGGLLQHLGAVAAKARREAGLLQSDIASAAGTNHATISRFETGESLPRKVGLDDLIAAYARELHVPAADLWSAALARWLG